ncbi:hypothetical protein CDD81_4444 [Ophiocordyceps australis]|uniref:F-box domain-containing protein n=1 Tax=Ophiocordyceps australis TaxID=1399860 RepID=A0A2C5XCA1_9HYPO|nr:hypothetical protein CDD81_4444 [Ophiocordyceps australis]
MASSPSDQLPPELWLLILDYIEPLDISNLSRVSRNLRQLCLDPLLWRRHCFLNSAWRDSLKKRRRSSGPRPLGQDIANWDPVYPGERVSWYTEYIQRHGPTSVNWLQTPQGHHGMAEARGLALYHPTGHAVLAVSPLDDGSICLWDVKGTRVKQGAILARSEQGLLIRDSRRPPHDEIGINEAISVDSSNHRAFIAAQHRIVEMDLNCLQVASETSFDRSITALSTIQAGVPLTVGTSSGLRLYDPRDRPRMPQSIVERLDGGSDELNTRRMAKLQLSTSRNWDSQAPLSILHLPSLVSPHLVTNDIFVAGRFPSILHCDRRKLPEIMESMYSGADIKSIAALACRFPTVEHSKRRKGQLSVSRAAEIKESCPGQTLIAGGSYSSKGSLEMYGLDLGVSPPIATAGFVNRQNAAPATIFSVINHGTKIAFSDGAGFVRWFERDGSTEIRRLRIGNCSAGDADSLFPSSRAAAEDLALKILSTGGSETRDSDEIVFWTGERLGMIGFTPQALFHASDFEAQSRQMSAEEEEREKYTSEMRRAIGQEADAVRFLNHFQL